MKIELTARERGVRLLAEFVTNERNRMMLVSYKFAGFRQVRKEGNFMLFEADLANVQPPPAYMQICVEA